MRVFFEFDFFDPSGATAFHLRHAYVQVSDLLGNNLLVGQTYSPFTDVDALPSTVDFEGPNSAPIIQLPLLQYTVPMGKYWSLAVSAAKPQSDVTLPDTSAVPIAKVPDLAFRLLYRDTLSGGHIQLGGLLRGLGYEDSTRESRVYGFGLQMSGVFRIGPKKGDYRDNVQFGGVYGHGVGRYINDIAGLGLDGAKDSNGSLKALPTYGGYIGVQHFWSKVWYSEASIGWLRLENTASQTGQAFRQSRYASVNLTYDPPGSVFAYGFEYLYGYHQQRDRLSAHASRVQAGFTFYFYEGLKG